MCGAGAVVAFWCGAGDRTQVRLGHRARGAADLAEGVVAGRRPARELVRHGGHGGGRHRRRGWSRTAGTRRRRSSNSGGRRDSEGRGESLRVNVRLLAIGGRARAELACGVEPICRVLTWHGCIGIAGAVHRKKVITTLPDPAVGWSMSARAAVPLRRPPRRLRRSRPRQLERAFFLSAFAALADPASRTYYDKKIARGKHHTHAPLCLASRRALLSRHRHRWAVDRSDDLASLYTQVCGMIDEEFRGSGNR